MAADPVEIQCDRQAGRLRFTKSLAVHRQAPWTLWRLRHARVGDADLVGRGPDRIQADRPPQSPGRAGVLPDRREGQLAVQFPHRALAAGKRANDDPAPAAVPFQDALDLAPHPGKDFFQRGTAKLGAPSAASFQAAKPEATALLDQVVFPPVVDASHHGHGAELVQAEAVEPGPVLPQDTPGVEEPAERIPRGHLWQLYNSELPLLGTVSRWVGACQGLLRGPAWSPERVAAFQSRRLRALVRHAYLKVPYYRRLYDQAGLQPDDIRGLADLDRIPLASRADLQALPAHQVLARGVDPGRLVLHRTSGSSGAPLSVWRTRFEERLLQAYRLRMAFGLGLRLTDRRASVSWYPPGSPPDRHFLMNLGLFRREEIHSVLPAEEILSQLRRIQPGFLAGYPGTLSWLAGSLTDLDRARICPRLIAVGAETLTHEMRRQISQGFRALVFDFYGSHEFNLIASECPRTGQLHIAEPMLIAEVLGDGRPVKPGEEGELVGTALHSYAMPFVRYRLGDLVTRGEPRCPCGAPFATILRIEGRVMERFRLPDGSSVHPYVAVDRLMRTPPWLRRYQIVQDRADHLTVKLAPMTEPPPGEVATLERLITAAFGGQVRVAIRLVNEIPPEPNGKFRPYYSLVGQDGEQAACPRSYGTSPGAAS